ncbi:MAG: hypothetical protein JJ858_06825 [Rhizobiaceae bacterium]|nr:hypothetical protein [Rhizobiaceae bacterium]
MSDSVQQSQPMTSFSPWHLRNAWLKMDQNPRAIEFAKSNIGIFVLHAAFIFVMALSQQFSNSALGLISLTIIGVAILPKYRIPLIMLSSVFYLLLRPFRVDGWSNLLNTKVVELPLNISPYIWQFSAVGAFLCFAFIFLKCINWQKTTWISKRPVLSLILIWASCAIIALLTSDQSYVSTFLWTFTGVLVSSLWFLAYAAVDQKNKEQTPLVVRSGFMRPFWGGSATPIGKSFGYLNKFDAKNDNELAVTRLKAIKLIVWALILTIMMHAMEMVARGYLNLPVLQEIILAHADGNPFATGTNWSSLIYNYFLDLVVIAIWGHFIVAVIRMIGYRIPRNTRNPLASRTLAEFWNRYFFYFKELLVDFFFYPTFVRYFKKAPKLRIAFATFCAAFLGNFLYHFARDTFHFAQLPFWEALAIFQSAAVYSVLLALGLILSQLNPYKPKPQDGFFRYEVLTRLNVIAFFCFLKIFDDMSGEGNVVERLAFLIDLFGA